MDTTITWQPLAAPYDGNDNGKLDPRERRALPDSAFAFPQRRELPLVDAEHILAAARELARVVQVSTEERELAAANVRAAAAYYGVELGADAARGSARPPRGPATPG
jgi:hypothetical protein